MNCLLQCIKFKNSDTEKTLTENEKENEKETEKENEKESKDKSKQVLESPIISKKLIDASFENDIVIIEPEHKQVLELPIICNEMYITSFGHK